MNDGRDNTVHRWAGGDFVLPAQSRPGEVLLCQACTRLGRCRLGLKVEELTPQGTVLTHVVCSEEHEGGPGVAHGGWTAGVLDELVGHVPLLLGVLAVTGSLNVRFIRPVPIERELIASAHVTGREGSRWFVTAELALESSGSVLATGEGILVERDPAHFARHQAWLQNQDRS